MTRTEAMAYLTRRHALMTRCYPAAMKRIPLSLYVSRNLREAMRMTTEGIAELDEATQAAHDLYSL